MTEQLPLCLRLHAQAQQCLLNGYPEQAAILFEEAADWAFTAGGRAVLREKAAAARQGSFSTTPDPLSVSADGSSFAP